MSDAIGNAVTAILNFIIVGAFYGVILMVVAGVLWGLACLGDWVVDAVSEFVSPTAPPTSTWQRQYEAEQRIRKSTTDAIRRMTDIANRAR